MLFEELKHLIKLTKFLVKMNKVVKLNGIMKKIVC